MPRLDLVRRGALIGISELESSRRDIHLLCAKYYDRLICLIYSATLKRYAAAVVVRDCI